VPDPECLHREYLLVVIKGTDSTSAVLDSFVGSNVAEKARTRGFASLSFDRFAFIGVSYSSPIRIRVLTQCRVATGHNETQRWVVCDSDERPLWVEPLGRKRSFDTYDLEMAGGFITYEGEEYPS